MSTTIASSSYRLPGHNPIHYDGSNYYAVTVDDTNHKAHVYKASSISGTWTEQDSSTTVPSSGDFDQTNPWLCSFLDSTGIIHIAGILNGFGGFFAMRFDTSTDQWYDYGAGTYQTGLGGDLSFAGNSAHFCEQGDGDIVAVFSGDAEGYHGDDKRRIDYRASTNNGTSWGSTTALDGGGDVHYGNSVCAPGATSTEFHCYAQRQTSTANDPPTSWADAWRTGNTSNSPTAGSASYDTGSVLRGFKHLLETNDTNEFRCIGKVTTGLITHVLNEANPIAEITAYSQGLSPVMGTGDTNYQPSAVAESDGSKMYVVYPDVTSQDIYLVTATAADDALDSTTATEIFDAVTAQYVDVSLVGTNLIVVWDNTSSVEVDTYSVATGGTINNETLQDLDSTVTTDAYVMEKSLRRDIADTIAANDTSLPLREAIRLILDTATATDDATATYTKGATIVSRTLQDLNSIAVADNSPPERERNREALATIDLNDLSEEERERIRLILEEADLSYSAETRHKRTIELLDSWIGMLDSITATTSKAPQGGTFTDEIDVTDALIMEKKLIRETLDTLAALDIAIVLRERYPAIVDSLGATDAIETFRQMERLTIDIASLSDDAIELRERNLLLSDSLASLDSVLVRLERNRTLFDDVAVTDSADATYVPKAGDIYEEQLSDLLAMTDALIMLRERYRVSADTLATVDADIELRKRYRLLTESIEVLDDVIVTGAGVVSKTIKDLIAAIDTATALRERYRLQADGIDISDSVKRQIENFILTIDAAAVTDFIEGERIATFIETDAAALTDTEIALRKRYRILAESIIVLDDVIAESTGVITRTLPQSIAATDFIETLRLLERELSDQIDAADSTLPHRVREQLLADSLTFNEFLVNFFARGRIATDSATIIDTAIATYLPEGILTYYKTVIEALSVTDSALGQQIYPLIDFIIQHSLQSLSVDHGLERLHIRHNVERET